MRVQHAETILEQAGQGLAGAGGDTPSHGGVTKAQVYLWADDVKHLKCPGVWEISPSV